MCVCVLIGLAAGEAHSEVAWEQVEKKKRGEVGVGICPEALEAKKGSRKKHKRSRWSSSSGPLSLPLSLPLS